MATPGPPIRQRDGVAPVSTIHSVRETRVPGWVPRPGLTQRPPADALDWHLQQPGRQGGDAIEGAAGGVSRTS